MPAIEGPRQSLFDYHGDYNNYRNSVYKRATAVFLLVAIPATFFIKNYLPYIDTALMGPIQMAALQGSLAGNVVSVLVTEFSFLLGDDRRDFILRQLGIMMIGALGTSQMGFIVKF